MSLNVCACEFKFCACTLCSGSGPVAIRRKNVSMFQAIVDKGLWLPCVGGNQLLIVNVPDRETDAIQLKKKK